MDSIKRMVEEEKQIAARKEAIKFADWIKKQAICIITKSDGSTKWATSYVGNNTQFTSKQLYIKFKKEKLNGKT